MSNILVQYCTILLYNQASAIRLYKNFLSQIDVENSKAERLADKEAIFDTVRQNTG